MNEARTKQKCKAREQEEIKENERQEVEETKRGQSDETSGWRAERKTKKETTTEKRKEIVKKDASFPRAGICLLEAAPPPYCSLHNDLLFCFDANENQNLFSK